MAVMATSFKPTCASMLWFQGCSSQCRWPPWQATVDPAFTGDSWTLTGKSRLVSCEITAPFSWVLVYTRFSCALWEFVSPVLWNVCNQIPLNFNVWQNPLQYCKVISLQLIKKIKFKVKKKIPWAFSVLLTDPHIGKSVAGPRTFTTVRELFWYRCSPVYRSSAWQLNSGPNGDLFREDLHHTSHLPGLL